MRLHNKVAIVTGAARGIGAAIATGFAREGAAVVVVDVLEERTSSEIVASGGRALGIRADVGSLGNHRELVERAVEAFGSVDILVNNAAIDRRAPFLEATPAQWDQVFDVDLKGPYFLAQAAARWMVANERPGAILNISSVHDEQPHKGNSLYTIAKGGMKMLTRNLALELAPFHIRVNALSPGAILTDMNRQVLNVPEYRNKVLEKIPLGRIGEVSEIVGTALVLVSDEGSYITGSTFYVDGGLRL
jgi:glucose 1-dehydrogenase